MPATSSGLSDILGLLSVFALVAANGFFVAAEFALVSMRPSRVEELVTKGRRNSKLLLHATENLNEYLAATQLGITLSSLALGWVGEPAIAHLIEPGLSSLLGSWGEHSAHMVAFVITFALITSLHIVIGELAPKSLAIQKSEATSLAVVRPLGLFLMVFRPAISLLNGAGNLVLKACGLRADAEEGAIHSPHELKLLVAESHEAGLLDGAQQEVVERVFNIGDRSVASIMTPRVHVDWIDLGDDRATVLKTIRECRHDQLLVARDDMDATVGIVVKKELLDQMLDIGDIDIEAALKQPLVIHESMPVFRVLDMFKKAHVRLAIVVDEYGSLEGVLTQTDLMEALAGDLPAADGDQPDIVTREDGSLLVEGMMDVREAFEKLGLQDRSTIDNYQTFAGYALDNLKRIPRAGESFETEGWRFEIVDMDGKRIDKIMATRLAA